MALIWKDIVGYNGKLKINSNLEVYRVDNEGRYIKKNIGKDECYTFHISGCPKRRVKFYVLHLEYFPEIYTMNKCKELEKIYKVKWKPLVDFEQNYLISENGKLCRLDRNSFANGSPKVNNEYIRVSLSVKQVVEHHYIHRLVAKTFIPNPLNKPHINHIDGDKSNNHVDNLEWVTAKENDEHKRKVLGYVKEGIHVNVYDIIENTYKTYSSYVLAGLNLGCCDLTVNNYANSGKLYKDRYKIIKI